MRNLWIALLVLAGMFLPAQSLAQSGGPFVRPDCTTLTGPVTFQTWCFDTTSGALKLYNGVSYVTLSGVSAATGSGVGTNVAIGLTTLDGVTTGYQLIAIGKDALNSATTAHSNIAIGTSALTAMSATDGTFLDAEGNIAIGDQAMAACTLCRENVAIGNQALTSATAKRRGNTAVGHVAMRLVESGVDAEANYNTAVGSFAMELATVGAGNTAVGGSALGFPTNLDYNSTGSNNTAIGFKAFQHAGTGANNAALGQAAMAQMKVATGNVAVGYRALLGSLDGSNDPFNTSGVTENVAVGLQAGLALRTGSLNVLVGSESGTALTTGSNNVAVGYNAGKSLTTATGNVFLGYLAGRDETGSNLLYITNNAGTTPLIKGDFSTNTVTITGSSDSSTSIVLGPWGGAASYTAIGLAGAVATGTYNFASSAGDTNLFINVPTGKAVKVRVNNADVAQIDITGIGLPSVLQAALGTPANGTVVYCSDCTTASACTGGGTGALASRQNAAWKCL